MLDYLDLAKAALILIGALIYFLLPLDLVAKDYDLDTLKDVLVIVRASKDLTIVDINEITDVVTRRVHEEAELEISASADLDGGDDVEIAIAIPRNTPRRRKKRRAAD